MTTPEAIPLPRRRVLTYDALRVFAILSVVAIHAAMPMRDALPVHSAARVIDDLLHYAVPLFVFISGALVWGHPRKRATGAFGRFVKGRLRVVALPYLAWALVFLAVGLLTSSDPTLLLRRAPGLLLTGHVWYHLYFVPMLLSFYLLTPLAEPLIRRWPELTVVAVYAARILWWPDILVWIDGVAPDLVWSYATHVATHLPHMVLGAWFAVRVPKPTKAVRRTWPVLLGAGTATLLAESLGSLASLPKDARLLVYPLGMASTVLGIALAAFWLEPHYDRFEHVILRGAALSFGVYFVHPLVLLALVSAVSALGADAVWRAWWALPVTWAVMATTSYAIAAALARSRRTAWLVGIRAGVGG